MSYPTPPTVKFFQSGTFTTVTSAAAGNELITLPLPYSSATSYVVKLTHSDSTAGLRFSVVNQTGSTYRLYWTAGGASTQPFTYLSYGI